MLKKKCKCGLIIPLEKSMCDECLKNRKNKYASSKNVIRKDYKEQQFYCSKRWMAVRDKVRHRDRHLCLLCLDENKIKQVNAIHHIIELKEDWSKRFDTNNLISLCREHHTAIHDIYFDKKEKQKLQTHLFDLVNEINNK